MELFNNPLKILGVSFRFKPKQLRLSKLNSFLCNLKFDYSTSNVGGFFAFGDLALTLNQEKASL